MSLPGPSSGTPAEGVLVAMGRREPLLKARAAPKVKDPREVFELPSPPAWLLLARAGPYLLAVTRWLAVSATDRLRGEHDSGQRARRIREALERLGGSWVRFGIEAATRIDVLDFALCQELSGMRDRAEPFPVDLAIQRLEAVGGRPLDQIFEAFDPEPIVSDSLACTYQARLRTGERVAVQVARPGVARLLAADIRLIEVLLVVAEVLTLVPPGRYTHLPDELRRSVSDELDLKKSARHLRLFKRFARRDRMRYARVTRVFSELCARDVRVTEFVSGVWFDELMGALHARDPEALAALEQLGIDPAQVARRLLRVGWYGLFESPLLHGLPHPSRVVIQEGGAVVFVSLADVGTGSRRLRRLHRSVMDALCEDDVGAAAEAIVQMLAPLPLIDTTDFLKQLEQRLWHELFMLRDVDAPREDRSGVGLWLSVAELCRQEGVPVRLDVLRMMRSFVLHHGLAAALDPKLQVLREYKRYRRSADRRTARAWQRRREKEQDGAASTLARVAEAGTTFKRLAFWLETTVDRLPLEFLTLSSKSAYVASVVIHWVLGTTLFVGVAAGLAWAYNAISGQPASLTQALLELEAHPFALGLPMVLLAITSVRRILFRLGDLDQND